MFDYAENFSMSYSLSSYNNNNGKKETDEERSQRIRDAIYKPPPRGESVHDLQVSFAPDLRVAFISAESS